VAFVRKARLTLFHFESCCCIFGAGVTASSIVEYWKQTSHSARHDDTSVTTVWQSIAAEFGGNIIYSVIFFVDEYGAFRPNTTATHPQTRVLKTERTISVLASANITRSQFFLDLSLYLNLYLSLYLNLY